MKSTGKASIAMAKRWVSGPGHGAPKAKAAASIKIIGSVNSQSQKRRPCSSRRRTLVRATGEWVYFPGLGLGALTAAILDRGKAFQDFGLLISSEIFLGDKKEDVVFLQEVLTDQVDDV